MIRQGLLSLVALLLCCSYSNAYEQQYQVGDTGPNGGVITSVDVASTLQDTQVKIVGGFEETTEYWQYLETIIEKVESIETSTILETTTTQVLTEKTTENTVCFGCDVMNSTSGGVTFYGDNAVFNYQGGTISGQVALQDYLIKEEINRGFDVSASADVMTCLNTVGSNISCYDVGNPTADTFNITISVTDGTSNYTNTTTHTIDWNPDSFQTVWGYLTVPQNNMSIDATATLELYGIDNGYWGGYYGPTATNPTMTFTYDEASYLVQTIERQIQQTVTNYITDELLTQDTVFSRTYIGDPTMDLDIAQPIQEVEGPAVVDIKPVSQDTFEVKIETSTPAGETKTEVMEIKVSEMKIEKIESLDGGDANEPVSETKPEGTSTEVAVKDGGDTKTSTKGSKSSDKKSSSRGSASATYNTVMESVRLAVMAQSEATQQFNTYTQVSLPVTEFYAPEIIDGGKTYDNPYAIWYMGASDALWNNMVDMQWQN